MNWINESEFKLIKLVNVKEKLFNYQMKMNEKENQNCHPCTFLKESEARKLLVRK